MARALESLLCLLIAGCSSSSSPAEQEPEPPSPQAPPSSATKDPQPASHTSDAPDFTRFVLESRPDTCHPSGDGDCESRVEITASGEVTLDPWGEPKAEPLTASVDRASLQTLAEAVLSDPLSPYFLGDTVCKPTHPSEVMTLERGGRTLRIETGHCNDAAVQAARSAAFDLARAAFPDHRVMEPPI